MPYKVFKNGSSSTPFCVYKIDADDQPTGESLGCHPSEQKAQDQIKAILINESEGKKAMTDKLTYSRAYIDRSAGVIPDDPNAPIRFVASTEGEKADGMNLKTADWLLGRYEKHPVILYAHDYMGAHLPLGSGKPLIDGSRLLMDVTFDPDDPFAQAVRAKTKKGLMGGSVGWQSVQQGNELLEFSIVPVPLDPDALPMRQAGGRRALQAWLDTMATEGLAADDQAETEEPSPLDDQSGKIRIGAVLSSRNLKDLETARDLLDGVISRSKKEADQGDDKKEDDQGRVFDPSLDEKFEAISKAINRLKSI